MKDPFTIRCTGYTLLTTAQLQEVIREKVRDTSGWIRPYRGYYKNHKLIVRIISGKNAFKISGTTELSGNSLKIDLVCQPLCSPYYLLVPVCCLFVFLATTTPMVINDEIVSRPSHVLVLLIFFLLLGLGISLPVYFKVREEFNTLAGELQLRTTN